MPRQDVPPQVNRLFLYGQKALIKQLIGNLQFESEKIDRKITAVEQLIETQKGERP